MKNRFPHIKRGRLSPEERAAIVTLAERGLNGGQIALRLNRHPSTVGLAMLYLGVREPATREFSYERAGRLVRSFTPDEDSVLTALRIEGLSTPRIAQALSDQFGHPRTAATVNIRLRMLAARPAA